MDGYSKVLTFELLINNKYGWYLRTHVEPRWRRARNRKEERGNSHLEIFW